MKGALRAEAYGKITPNDDFLAIFGPETSNASEFAGALSCGDARILLFPVRSLAGVFAWVTSLEALARLERVAALTGQTTTWNIPAGTSIANDECWINGNTLVAGNSVVLEEFAFSKKAGQDNLVSGIASWLTSNAFPSGPEYAYWKQELPKKLCILPENAFRDFVLYSTEVQTHVKLNASTKTVDEKIRGLWTAESLPADSLLYAPLLATKSRNPNSALDAAGILSAITNLDLSRMQFGGDETTGQGITALKFL